MFDSLRNHTHLSRPETDVPVAHLNRHPAFQDEKEVVRVVMFVPHEFALQFRDHDVVPIELTNSSWLPMLGERREAFRQINSLHVTDSFSMLQEFPATDTETVCACSRPELWNKRPRSW